MITRVKPKFLRSKIEAAMTTKSERTRIRILDAAAATFSKHGYAGARLEDVAEAADTKAGSLYYHFASRDELVMEVLRLSIERITSAVVTGVGELPEGTSYRDRIRAAIDIQILNGLNQQDTYTAAAFRITTNLPPNLRRQVYEMQRGFGDFWRDLLEAAQKAGEINPSCNVSVIRMLLMGALNWSIEWYRPNGQLTSQEIGVQLYNMLFDGVSSGNRPVAKGPAARNTKPAKRPRAVRGVSRKR